jgi:hypothetical protein
MPNVEFSSTGRQLTAEDLVAVARRLGISIPSDLTAHYLRRNGGRPDRRYFEYNGYENELLEFATMLESGSKAFSFEATYEHLVGKEKVLPPSLVPFATNSGGDYYCVDSQTQEIYFWAHELSDEPSRALRKAAPSLLWLLEHLQTEAEFFGSRS